MGSKKKSRGQQRKAKVQAEVYTNKGKKENVALCPGVKIVQIGPNDDLVSLFQHLHSFQHVTSAQMLTWIPGMLDSIRRLDLDYPLEELVTLLLHKYLEATKNWTPNEAVENSNLPLAFQLSNITMCHIDSLYRSGGGNAKVFLNCAMTLSNFLQDIDGNGDCCVTQEAVNKACEALAPLFDSWLPNGYRFLEICKIYQHEHIQLLAKFLVAREAVDAYTNTHFYNLMHMRLNVALKPVFDETFSVGEPCICWECGLKHVSADHLYKCGSCKVAQYDGKKCQLAAWKKKGATKIDGVVIRGHKKQCELLASKYALFHANINTIERVHSANEYPELQLNKASDYCILAILFDSHHLQQKHSFYEELVGPSMEYFYANLASIAQGGAWAFDSIVDCVLDSEEGEGNEDEKHHFLKDVEDLARFLSYDILGFVEQRYSVSDPTEIWSIVAGQVSSCTQV